MKADKRNQLLINILNLIKFYQDIDVDKVMECDDDR